jgi:preprotein translocase subunit SecE
MNTNVTVPQNTRSDVMKWTLAIVLLTAGMIGFYYFADYHIIVRVGGLVLLALIATYVATKTTLGQQTLSFLHESHIEVRKVVWPTLEDTIQTTGIVALVVVIVAIFVWLIDISLMQLMRLVTGA